MAEERSDKPRIPHPEPTRLQRDRRRRLPSVLRYLIVASFGCLIAILAYYLLRTIGY